MKLGWNLILISSHLGRQHGHLSRLEWGSWLFCHPSNVKNIKFIFPPRIKENSLKVHPRSYCSWGLDSAMSHTVVHTTSTNEVRGNTVPLYIHYSSKHVLTSMTSLSANSSKEPKSRQKSSLNELKLHNELRAKISIISQNPTASESRSGSRYEIRWYDVALTRQVGRL